MSQEETKVMALEDVFSDSDLHTAENIYRQHKKKPIKGGLAKALCEQVTKDSLQTINWRTGQENDPMYLAYALEHALTQADPDYKENDPEPLEKDAVEMINELVSLMKEVVEEHDFWHNKKCYTKMQVRKKIDNCRNYLKDLGLYE